jgi:hypothetical protein
MSMKNSNDTIGNGTRDFPACSAVPQSNAPLHTPAFILPFHIYADNIMALEVYHTDNSLLFLSLSSILNYIYSW